LRITSQRNHKQGTSIRNTRTQNLKLKIDVTMCTWFCRNEAHEISYKFLNVIDSNQKTFDKS